MNLNLVDLFLVEGSGTVEGDLLKDVVLLGPESTNGNSYTGEAMKSAVPLYEGRAVYLDHDLKAKARKVAERFGRAESVRFVESDHDGRPRVRGDIRFYQSHPMAQVVVEDVTKRRGAFGISHVADGRGVKANGKKLVEQITRVTSLDLVDRAATGTLIEQEDAADASPEAPVAPEEMMAQGMEQMLLAIYRGDGTPQEKADKMKALMETAEGTGADPAAAAPPADDAPADDAPMSEQRVLKRVGALIEQAVNKAMTASLPQLVEQGVAARLAGNRYVKPSTQPAEPATLPEQKAAPKVPTEPAARKKWLHSNGD